MQTVNDWDSDERSVTRDALVPDVNKLSLANIPFRLLAIGNRLDLFKADSITDIKDAGGEFVFTLTDGFELPGTRDKIWQIKDHTFDISKFTLIFEYGQIAKDTALAKWAKDWHARRNRIN